MMMMMIMMIPMRTTKMMVVMILTMILQFTSDSYTFGFSSWFSNFFFSMAAKQSASFFSFFLFLSSYNILGKKKLKSKITLTTLGYVLPNVYYSTTATKI